MSASLSIAAVLGLALVPLLPDHSASTFTRVASPFAVTAPVASAAPVALVGAKPVPVPATPPLPSPAAATEIAAPASLLEVAMRRSRNRQRAPQPESGDLGKGGAGPRAEKTPVAPADPKSAAAKVEPAPPPDVWSDAEIIAALRDCLKRLAPLGAEIEIAPPVKQEQCGSPAPVLLKRIGSGANRVEFQPPPMLNCAMVASLHTWVEKTLQPAAQELLGSPIARLRNASGYVCRNRQGGTFHSDRLSEHALANAIDIAGFVTADGRTIDLATKWGPTVRDIREQQERAAEAKAAAKLAEKQAAEAARAAAKTERGSKRESARAEAARKQEEAERKREEAEQKEAERRKSSMRTAELQKLGRGSDAKADPKAVPVTGPASREDARKSAEAAFLRRLHKGACSTFGTVLGPEANEAHRDHFHFDLAPRRRSAFCE